jgi:hypothetical protein
VPAVHTQTPFVQAWLLPQRMPQPPQLFLSVRVFTHVVPHAVWPGAQVHAPPEQVCVAPQALPQPPQLLLLLVTSMHTPPQAAWPAPH